MPVELGQDLLQYRPSEKIGEGGMGVVWRGCASDVPPETPELAFASPNGPVIVAHRGRA